MGGMLGYGPFHYRYASGRDGNACKLSIASNASYISLYCFAADAKGYVAERYVERLPKASIRTGLRAVREARGPRREDARGAHQSDREEGPRCSGLNDGEAHDDPHRNHARRPDRVR